MDISYTAVLISKAKCRTSVYDMETRGGVGFQGRLNASNIV